jgi:hypothetical protein
VAFAAARLRRQIDLNAMSAELLAMVEQAVQSTKLLLWLRSLVAS